jgi:hypothetical protein
MRGVSDLDESVAEDKKEKHSTASVWPHRNLSSPLIEDGRRVLTEKEQNGLECGPNELKVYVMCEIAAGQVSRGY